MFSATLLDGYTAKRHPVNVVVEPHRLRLFTKDGEPLDEWTLSGLRLAEKVERGRPVRLVHAEHGRARLIFDTPAIVSELRRAGLTLRTDRDAWRGLPIGVLIAVVVSGGLAIGLLSGSTLVTDPLVRLVPLRWEKTWGREIVEAVAQEAPLCEGAAGQQSLRTLVDRLADTIETPFPLTVHVHNAPVVNAVALPGGQIVVFRGLLEAATTAEEVAGILAHEMAHQVQRHPTRGVVRKLGVQTVMSFISGNTGNFIGAATGALINLSHSREDESEADCIGIAMLNKANIRADGLLEFFERMGSEGGTAAASTQRKNARQPGLLAFFSTHPSDAARTAAIRRMAYGTGNALAANEWQALKTICGTTEDGQDDPLFRLFR